MIVAVDVHYKDKYAKTVVLIFESWNSETYSEMIEVQTAEVSEYIPGEFYKRELPCLLESLKNVNLKQVDCIIIDGYVYVDDAENSGLGKHLYNALNQNVPVVGVAKTGFHTNKTTVVEVFRGKSKNPLYISAIGIDTKQVAQHVQQMYGEYRLPYLLKVMDQKTKEA